MTHKETGIERRAFNLVEIRSNEDGTRKLHGTAVVFNQRSADLGGFCEEIDPDSLDDCDMSDVRCLINHDQNKLLGRSTSGTLTLSRDANGLNFECDMPDTSYARDLAVSMERGDLNQCSFAFQVKPGGFTWSEDKATKTSVRRVTGIKKIVDVSLTSQPAYSQTSSELRTAEDILADKPGFIEIETPASQPTNNSGSIQLDLLRRKLDLTYKHI